MAKFGFGTYRIADTNQSHIDSLIYAINNGIDLIDTSTNYFDGGSERAIAKALKSFDESKKDDIKIVSKFGYIQGSLLKEFYENSNFFKNSNLKIVKYSNDCYHCISKDFVFEMLNRSLKRMELDCIDCYLIHNPEYFILDQINKGETDKNIILDEMFDRIYESFVALEEEVKNGRIKSYGISSNSFSKNENEKDFLPYEGLIDIAKKAATKVGNKKHSFTTIQLPINILEKEGLKCSFWAKDNGLRVLANRPLNAFFNNKMYRLAQYQESRNYYMYLNELLEYTDNDLLKDVYNLINDLDSKKHMFGFVGNYDMFIHTQVLPYLQKVLKDLDGDVKEKLIEYINLFLVEYRIMVEYETSRKTKDELKVFFKDCNEEMQRCALKYLLNQESIDYVLVGARRIKYVEEILSIKDEIKNKV